MTILIYFSDVTEEHGPMHYVPRSKSIQVCEPKILKEYDTRLQEKLKDLSSSSASPAGSIFAYGIDVYHRGTNMTKPNGYRYAIMACYKKSGNDSIGYCSWPWHHNKPWNIIFHLTEIHVRDLAVIAAASYTELQCESNGNGPACQKYRKLIKKYIKYKNKKKVKINEKNR